MDGSKVIWPSDVTIKAGDTTQGDDVNDEVQNYIIDDVRRILAI